MEMLEVMNAPPKKKQQINKKGKRSEPMNFICILLMQGNLSLR